MPIEIRRISVPDEADVLRDIGFRHLRVKILAKFLALKILPLSSLKSKIWREFLAKSMILKDRHQGARSPCYGATVLLQPVTVA